MLQFYEKNFERGDKLGLKASKFQRKEKSMYSIRKLIRTESLMFNFFFINFVHWELFHKVEKVNTLVCCKFFNQSPTHFKDDFLGGENIVWQLSCTCIYIGYTTGP